MEMSAYFERAAARLISRKNVRRLAQRSIALGGSPVISREDVEVVFSLEAVLGPLERHEETVKRHIIEQEDEDDSGCS
uniref:Uncharacterized protein n=1 Tax=Rhizobium meliloti TaxID=382 RepID=I2E230_RHIML|nr:short hypothetical protein [Sinorhizobium meliloti]